MLLSTIFPASMVLEGSNTGGYPQADAAVYWVPNPVFPIRDMEWRGSVTPCELGKQFFDAGEQNFPVEAVRSVAKLGGTLIQSHKEVHLAVRSLQERKMLEQEVLVENANKWLGGIPEIHEDVAQIHHIGAIPTYRGHTPPGIRTRGLSRNPNDTELTMSKLLGYFKSGEMFVCAESGLPPGVSLLTSPSTTVAEKLPDRTVSTEKRLIWEGRRVNIHRPEFDYWHLDTPDIQDLDVWEAQIRAEYPGIDIVGAKRDIDASFTRCRLRPDAALMFATEFKIGQNAADNIIFMYLVLPIGFTWSPGIFGRAVKAIGRFHSQHKPTGPVRNGAAGFQSQIFAGDGMFLEPLIGCRAAQSVGRWELGARLFLGINAIRKQKLELACSWTSELLLLGYYVDLKEDTISLPDPNLVDAFNLVQLPVCDHGNMAVDIHALQELRGCVNHWLPAGRVWKWLVGPVNGPLGFYDNTLIWARCADLHRWSAFWNVIGFLRDVTAYAPTWRSHFP